MNILITTSSFNATGFPDGYNIIKNPYKRKLAEAEIEELIEKYQPIGIIAGVEPLSKKVLEKAKNLKIISRCGIGLDSVDMEAAKELGIEVQITPEAPKVSVGELTIALILNIIRRVNTLDSGIRIGVWKGPKGNLLSGKTIGIIGCGRIGTYVGKILKAFGCNVLGYDPYIKNHDFIKMISFEKLIEESDIITLHIPYSKENHYLIGKKEISNMKENCLLINVARGGLIDEDALYEALKEFKIKGAALDCFEEEPYKGKLINLTHMWC